MTREVIHTVLVYLSVIDSEKCRKRKRNSPDDKEIKRARSSLGSLSGNSQLPFIIFSCLYCLQGIIG